MSGITGLFYFDQRPVAADTITRMTDALIHRGSDAGDIWRQGSVGLGSRMLWTTPESLSENLPLVSDDRKSVITADARLDNRAELINAFGLTGQNSSQITDSALILLAYQKWGTHCPEYLLGDFVFVIWDAIEQHLFAARDHMGLRPFYYHRAREFFAFGSEIKALLTLDAVPCQLNEVRVADFLASLFDDKDITFYEGISRLPPASCLLVKPDVFRTWSYWSLEGITETRLSSDQEYQEAFLDLFSEAVHCRLRSAYPVGSMLSGGLDSSSVATVARDFLLANGNQDLHTFSAIFDEVKECDERTYIDPILQQGGFDPHFLHADQIGPLTDIEKILWTQDEAFFSPNRFMHWGLYKLAAQSNVRVLLDGIDGDTTVSHGLTRLIELARTLRWGTLSHEVSAISKRSGRSLLYVWREGVLKSLVPYPVYDAWRSLRKLPISYGISNPTIHPDFADRVGLAERFNYLRRVWLKPDRRELQVHRRQLEWGLHPFVLEGLNKAASYFQIEPRYPFYDKRLVEFCLSLPPSCKLRQGWTRWILRTSLHGSLPPEVQWRPKKTWLGSNFSHGFLAYGRTEIEDIILGDFREIENYVDKQVLSDVYQRYRITKSTTDEMYIWTAIVLAIWLQQTKFDDYCKEVAPGAI